MTTLTKRATVYFDPTLHRALRLKSVETSRSVSDLLNDAIRCELAEDAQDLNAFDARNNEPTIAFEDFVKDLKRNGKNMNLKRAVEMLAARERKEHKARNASKGRISLCSVRSFAANQSSPNW